VPLKGAAGPAVKGTCSGIDSIPLLSPLNFFETLPVLPGYFKDVHARHVEKWSVLMFCAIASTLRLAVASAITLVIVCLAAEAGDATRLESSSVLSRYQAYAEQVTAECIRNRAYGLSTNGLPLIEFCQKQGNTAAMQVHPQLGAAQPRLGGANRP
jgi:hypothetical protein